MFLVFDLDDTLCKVGKRISNKNCLKLKKLSKNNKILIASGKPLYYLTGFVRQLGIYDCILIGENGALIQYGIELPSKTDIVSNDIIKTKKQLEFLKNKILKELNNIWFQPNEICLTPFPTSEYEFNKIKIIVEENREKIDNIEYFFHFDSVDFIEKGINKKSALEFLKNKYNISEKDFFVIGNSTNDYPMFEFTENSIGINLKDIKKAKYNFKTIDKALDFLIDINKN